MNFDTTCEFINNNVEKFYSNSKKGRIFNVNVPDVPKSEIKGVKIVKYGEKMFEDEYIKHYNPETNETTYSLEGDFMAFDAPEESDAYYAGQNYITITPLHFDLCDDQMIEQLKEVF